MSRREPPRFGGWNPDRHTPVGTGPAPMPVSIAPLRPEPEPVPEPRAEVLHLPEGGLLVLTGVDLDAHTSAAMIETIVNTAGHSRFAILVLRSGEAAEVWGPDTDHVAKLRALLEASDG